MRQQVNDLSDLGKAYKQAVGDIAKFKEENGIDDKFNELYRIYMEDPKKLTDADRRYMHNFMEKMKEKQRKIQQAGGNPAQSAANNVPNSTPFSPSQFNNLY